MAEEGVWYKKKDNMQQSSGEYSIQGNQYKWESQRHQV